MISINAALPLSHETLPLYLYLYLYLYLSPFATTCGADLRTWTGCPSPRFSREEGQRLVREGSGARSVCVLAGRVANVACTKAFFNLTESRGIHKAGEQ
jgi:hypothetical protein